MSPVSPELAIVIPAWNERENLELLLPALRETLAGLGVPAEVVVVDGGSDDGTREAALRRGARVVGQEVHGYAGALLAGFAATEAAYVVTMDADLSHRPLFLESFWQRRDEGEVLVASRYVAGGRADMGWFRRLLSQILNRAYRRTLSLPLRDLSSGFRMYRRDVVTGLTLEARDFDVLEEILIRVHAEGWRIIEVPFHYMARGSGRSHARLVKFDWAFLKTLVRMWRLRNSVVAADYDYRAFDSPICSSGTGSEHATASCWATWTAAPAWWTWAAARAGSSSTSPTPSGSISSRASCAGSGRATGGCSARAATACRYALRASPRSSRRR